QTSRYSFFFSSRRRHTRFSRDWSSDVCSSDLNPPIPAPGPRNRRFPMDAFIVFLQKNPFNMMLFGGAVATGAMLLWPLLMRPFRAGREVSVQEAVQLIN